MIKSINVFSNIKTRTVNKIHSYTSSIKSKFPKLSQLKQDIFELREGKPEVLLNSPPIIQGKFNSGIKDCRFKAFATEYRAYNYEGYDNKFPNDYVCIDSKGERRLKPHLYLDYVEVKPEFARQGLYSNAIRQLALFAKYEEGCDGRIILEARKMTQEDVTKIPSPSIAHWKCGFRFANEKNNEMMQQVMLGNLPPEAAPEGTMYYSLI